MEVLIARRRKHTTEEIMIICVIFFFFFLMFSVWLFVRVKRNDMTKIRTCALVNGDSVLNKIPFSPR